MADDPILRYLPAGWTEDRYHSASDKDWESLSEEELEKIMQRSAVEAKLQSARPMTQINEARVARGAAPIQLPPTDTANEEISPTSTNLDALVQLVESTGWDDFGYLMFRTDYSDDELWETFLEDYDPVLQQGMDALSPDLGIDRIREKLYMKIVSDDCMADRTPELIALAYRMFKEDDDIEPGLETKMCLLVDNECMRSVVEKKEPGSVPFVKAVDVTLGQGHNLGYPGHFKVAISSLVTEFYLELDRCDRTVDIAPIPGAIWQCLPGTANA